MSNLSPNNYQDIKGWLPECHWCGLPDHRSEDCPEAIQKTVEESVEEIEQSQSIGNMLASVYSRSLIDILNEIPKPKKEGEQ